jgi:hypothetical protein
MSVTLGWIFLNIIVVQKLQHC